ncbi:hypothetical protein RJ639_029294 [Escallonia herrerae]|uniref:B3 domain-containing protein n=1 Tax=Escallonia herrerae TaxID=1293975 RepID=A0AA88XC85_9ASTE|nr:hypothetical protein RJ639_029294 [Escallonia herrerae]
MSSCLALSNEEKERNSRNNIRAILHLLGYYDHGQDHDPDPDHQLIETTLHHDQNPSKNHRQIHLLPDPPLPLHKRKRSFSGKRKFVPSGPPGDYNDPDNDGDGDISSCISIDDHRPATHKNQDLPYTLVFHMAGERKVLLRPKLFGDASAEEKPLKKRNKMTVKKETPGEVILPRHYPLGLPQKFKKLIGDMGGSDSEAVLVIQKKLFKTDVSKIHGRLSMPVSQTSTEFLTAEETRALNSKREVAVELIEPMTLAKRGLKLTKWEMGKNGTYNLLRNWNSVLVENGLEKGMVVQLWAFRVDSVLHIALVVVNQE